MQYDVVIIGAGHNGLTAAFYLAQQGLKVHLVEARNRIGGACVTEELIPDFKFSTCANVACWLRPKVAEDLKLVERGLKVWGYNVTAKIVGDNTPFVAWDSLARQQEEVARFSKADAEALPRWGQF